ncbi:MAG TPA: hypothetical protein VK582_19100, partial [Pyrinomonadaceae bacterium]|nr:hypothetical protein [Pyrinomonadaceae bacterium]
QWRTETTRLYVHCKKKSNALVCFYFEHQTKTLARPINMTLEAAVTDFIVSLWLNPLRDRQVRSLSPEP